MSKHPHLYLSLNQLNALLIMYVHFISIFNVFPIKIFQLGSKLHANIICAIASIVIAVQASPNLASCGMLTTLQANLEHLAEDLGVDLAVRLPREVVFEYAYDVRKQGLRHRPQLPWLLA